MPATMTLTKISCGPSRLDIDHLTHSLSIAWHAGSFVICLPFSGLIQPIILTRIVNNFQFT